ncbi:hypothetical protein PD482P1_00002 [Parabacteroides phage PD482P1]|nr:hypothetical protein PD482P1_00002 [Parabacteroides phage PD482P1]
MTPNNNLNPLAFYKSQNDMFRARPYNYGIKYPLYMPLNRVTPFQIIRGLSESTTLTSAKIYNDRGVEVATVTSYMSVNVVTIGASKVMQFKCGNYANLTPGQYTMRVVIGNDTYYSEVFTAYANIGKLVKVEYYNADPIIFDEGALTYDNGFKFELYLCTEIAKPEYLFEEESTKRGGFTFVENQISSKQYKMVIAAPEYLCDAIRIIRLHDHVAITKDGNVYEAYNFTPSYQWNDVGDLAQVTITFESNTVLQKISAYKGSQSVFKNALLAAASVPIMFSPNVIAQYGASVDGVAEAYTEFTGKLIRQLEEQTTLPKEAWVAIDTGTGEAKKMSIGLLGGGTGKPSELWTNDKKIKYLYIKEDNSEAYITKQFIGDSNIMAKGDIVAYQSGNWDLVTPTAGYDTLGMARFNSSDFTIDNGLVGLKVGAVGQRYYAGKGLSLASINGGTDNQFNVVFGELENTVMQGNDARFLKLYNGTWWGQAFDKSTGIVKGAMTSVDSINTLVYFNTDKSILVTKNKSAEGIKFSGGNSINGVYGSATNNLYLNYTDTTHNVKIDANHNIFANGDIVAYASGNYDISKPLAGYDAIGMSRYDKTQFEVVNGLVRIIDGGGGGTIAGIEITGNGNAFTNASMKSDNTVISFDKGITFWHAGNDGKNSGLDADLVDGYHAGFENNRVALYANFPSWSALISQGLLRSDYVDAGHPTEDYIKAICKWAIKNYPNIGNVTLQGKAAPNSSGWLVLSLYSDTGFDATTLLPRYCSGQYNNLDGNLQLFGTNNYVWRYSGTFQGNAASATKLQTDRTIWGQNFNGTQNVSGNMTGVGNITMSGNIYMGNNRNIYAKNPDGSDMAIFYTNTNSELVIGTGNTQKGTNTYLSGYEIIFRTSTSVEERMRIISNGNVGIGTTAPAAKLDIKGNQDLIHLQAKADGKDEYNYIRAYNTDYDSSFRFVEASNKILWFQYGKGGSNQLYSVNISGMSSEALKEFRVKAKDSFFEGNVKASGDVVAYQSGTWDIVKPIAGKDALGMIKVGSGLSIDVNGVLSSTGGGGSIAGVTPGTAGDFVYELASNGNNIVYNRKTFASVLDGRYVKKAGDTMTGKLKINSQLEILSDITDLAITLSRTVEENDAYPDIAMIMKLNDKKIGYVSGDLKKGTVLGNYQSGKSLQISPTGYLTFGGQNVWHAGNDGKNSGLDADMLDGLHNTAFARADQNPAVDLNTVNGRGIMTNTANANATTERHYPIAQAGVLFYGTAAYGSANQIYGSFSSNRWFARGGGGNESATGNSANKTNWREFAFTDSNVASATKLQTARTIWGKSFNGTADISGNLSNVSSIYSTNSTFAIYKNDKYIISSNNAGQLNINAYDANIILFGYRGTSGYSFYAGTGAGDAVGSEIGYWTNDVFTIKTNIKSYHVYPITNNTYDLGTSSARWKRLYLSGVNGNWLMGKTDGSIMVDSSNSSTSTYFPLYRWKTYTGRVFNLGGLQGNDNGHQFGFYMFAKDQTENRTNASFCMYSNGNMNGTHSLIMQQDVVAYGSSSYNITSPTAGYDALGLARFDSTYFTVSSGYVTLKASATSPIRSVTATTLNPGSNANASWNSSTGALSLGIPRGNTGATGTQGASVTYQWSGTSLRMGVTPYGGSTSWGSYVNLKGATGSAGPTWNGGTITNNLIISPSSDYAKITLKRGSTDYSIYCDGTSMCFSKWSTQLGYLSGSGVFHSVGGFVNDSDIRKKIRLENVTGILNKLSDISAFYYVRRDNVEEIKKVHVGLSAQEILSILPEVVYDNYDNATNVKYYSLDYATLGAVIAVNGLKEVQQLVQDNKNEIDLLKIEIAALRERLSKLEAA